MRGGGCARGGGGATQVNQGKDLVVVTHHSVGNTQVLRADR